MKKYIISLFFIEKSLSEIEFDVDPINKDCLVKGLDDIGSTLEKVSFIDEFESELFDKRPWNIPS